MMLIKERGAGFMALLTQNVSNGGFFCLLREEMRVFSTVIMNLHLMQLKVI